MPTRWWLGKRTTLGRHPTLEELNPMASVRSGTGLPRPTVRKFGHVNVSVNIDSIVVVDAQATLLDGHRACRIMVNFVQYSGSGV